MGDVAVAHKRRELILSVLSFVMLPLKKRFGKVPSYVQRVYGVQLDGMRKIPFGLKPRFAAYEACISHSETCLRPVLYDQIHQIEVPNNSPKFCVLSVLPATRFVNQYNTSYIIFCVVLKGTVAVFKILGDG
tara:strand:- start:585 stop:980 length:396 start_codon:yes stop_codon:yes gene_type:complete